uniref:SPRY domain-containing protein n=1 Tax=Angiostrongylus cantonensis TaxID=6313 RepID=A0A0K0DKC3_ANGCA
LFEVAAGLKPKRKEEVIVEERIPESTEKFEIDFYNGDLHLKGSPTEDWVIDPDNQDGLALMWGGVRSTYGIFPSSFSFVKAFFLLFLNFQIIELLPTKHLPFDELDPNDVRVGFSFRSAPLVLGEYPGSYCYTSLGKRANNNIFSDYGDSFTIGDVITLLSSCSNLFWKNSESMGPAFTNITVPENEAVYPHICVKNCRVSVNFGTFPGGEEEWNNPEWIFPNSLSCSQTERAPLPPESKSDCTVLMMVGLPSVGKTTWVRRYIREHPSENWTLISADTILAAMKVNGVSRNSSHIGRWDMVLGLVGKARNRLLSLAARRRRNYILDFTNCDPDTRKKLMQQRHARHLRQNRGEGTAAVPIETFLELKGVSGHYVVDFLANGSFLAVMEMPVVSEFLESVIYVDPAMEDAQIAIDRIANS